MNRMIFWILLAVLAALLLIGLSCFKPVFRIGPIKASIPTSSMAPTIQLEDVVLAERVSWKLGLRPLQPGDIIFFKFKEQYAGKRIVAVGGQRVMIKDCYVYVEGQPLTSDKFNHPNHPDPQRRCYCNGGRMQPGVEVFVPQGHYFVLGDNSTISFDPEPWVNSLDSRFEQVGFAKRENVYGRIFLRIWPPWRWGVP